MSHRPRLNGPGRLLAALAGALLLGGALAAPARGAGYDKAVNSLALVPADAAFYTAMLRNREQVDIVRKSKAWAKIKDMPAFGLAWQAVQDEYSKDEGKLAGLRKFYEQDENKDLVALIVDALSDEIFCYGGPAVTDLTGLLLKVNAAQQYAPLTAQLEGKTDQNKARIQAVLKTLNANVNLINTPDLVLGFKIKDARKAETQIKRLEVLLRGLEEMVEPLKGRVKRVKVGESHFLTLRLDGDMVPWDQIPLKDVEDKAGEYDDLIARLKGLKLAISLGVHGDYLLLGVGPSAAHLGRLGKGKLLADRPAFKPLARYSAKRLTSVGYISKAFKAEAAGSGQSNLAGLVGIARKGLAKADLPDDKRKQIDKDLHDFLKDLSQATPKVGAGLSFSFLTDRGFEGYSYDYSAHPGIDSSKPLTLLNHVGGAPILAVVARAKHTGAGYEQLVKWIKVAHGHADDILKDKLPEEDRKKYEEFNKAFTPLLERLDSITSRSFLPALEDGQIGFVLDARWSSKQWHKNLPETDKALPLPEIGLVLGVSDAAKLRKAMADYRKVANEAVEKLRELSPEGKIPPGFKIPQAQTEKVKGGTLYFHTLPDEWGLDKQVVPTGGLGARVAVLTLSHGMAERLLARKPLDVDGGPLADAKERHLAAAAYVNWPALVDALTPWVDLAVEKSTAGKDIPPPVGDVGKQARTVLEVLKCFRGITSATYLEDDVLVTHSESFYRDL